MRKVYIVVGNDGFPRFADPECSKLFVAASREIAQKMAEELVKESPFVIFGVYELTESVFSDGSNVIVVPADAKAEEVKA